MADQNNAGRIILSLNMGIVTLNQDGTILTLNPAASAILGLDQDQATGRFLLDALPGGEANQALLDMVRAFLNTGQEFESSQVDFQRPGQQARRLLASGWGLDREGVALSLEDVTEQAKLADSLKAQQEELRGA